MSQVPGLGSIANLMNCSAPNREQTTAMLAEGNIVGVAPGGGRQVVEAGSARNYSLEILLVFILFAQAMLGEGWGRRRGYAVVALKVDMIYNNFTFSCFPDIQHTHHNLGRRANPPDVHKQYQPGVLHPPAHQVEFFCHTNTFHLYKALH